VPLQMSGTWLSAIRKRPRYQSNLRYRSLRKNCNFMKQIRDFGIFVRCKRCKYLRDMIEYMFMYVPEIVFLL
jgi:hypothetical protein